jgi:SAM-dependent methyltransferase
MDEYLKKNRELWNALTPIHARSEFYDVEGFKQGRCTLKSIELEELGDVSGKSMLHLQCHFGMDTLSWARLGAKVTGVDFSDEAIAQAHSLSEETGIPADFVCSNIYDLPDVLEGQFDIVFTSYGILAWLPNLKRWSEVITHFLRPGGTFYTVEIHRILLVFDDSADCHELRVTHSYFPTNDEPLKFEKTGSYADSSALLDNESYEWTHSLGDVASTLTGAGLRINFLHEFPVCCYKALPFMEEDEEGWWRLEGDRLPLTFSIKATKPVL